MMLFDPRWVAASKEGNNVAERRARKEAGKSVF
jgi:hypothetical protein